MPPPTFSKAQREDLLKVLKARFENNMGRHESLQWADIEAKLVQKGVALWSLGEMERTGGEPDVIGRDNETGEYVFCDCSAESPQGRRNVCYDHRGQEKREKEGLRPTGNVLDMAAAMKIEPLTEEQYRELQKVGRRIPWLAENLVQTWNINTPSETLSCFIKDVSDRFGIVKRARFPPSTLTGSRRCPSVVQA
jgi:Protein of unknown function (DUF4256)